MTAREQALKERVDELTAQLAEAQEALERETEHKRIVMESLRQTTETFELFRKSREEHKHNALRLKQIIEAAQKVLALGE